MTQGHLINLWHHYFGENGTLVTIPLILRMRLNRITTSNSPNI
jgi:hypothetical protein